MKIGLQMYTVRDQAAKDLYGTLTKVAEMGYQGIEFKYTGEQDPVRMKEHLSKLGIEAASVAVSAEMLENDFENAAAFIQTLGSQYAMCPIYKFESKQEYLEMARKFNEIGSKFKALGIQFSYHNHGHEFNQFDGEYGLDILFQSCDPELVHAEIDVCFVQMADLVPAAYIQKYTGRCSIVHMKDYKPGTEQGAVEVGQGIIDVRAVYEAAEQAGVSWFIVEQEQFQRPSLESAKMCLDYVKEVMK